MEEGKPLFQLEVGSMEEWERIFLAGSRGTHLLFTPEMIRRAFQASSLAECLANVDTSKVQRALTDLAGAPSLADQQHVVETLDDDTRNVLVQIYFDILDRFLFDEGGKPEVLH
ncbi:MAG: hypothetical protein D6806_00675 [Deltaproteobacteria bacterium]|nr:MAG: hypothetical protein D6806_00675 [Deltaproteobacteria bacterium]